jgi:hypothetical protein
MEHWKSIDLKVFIPAVLDKMNYFVSDLGHLFNLSSSHLSSFDDIKPNLNGCSSVDSRNGHMFRFLKLRYKGHIYKLSIALLVSAAFIDPAIKNYDITFIDGDSSNCSLTNLKLVYRYKSIPLSAELVGLYDRYCNSGALYRIMNSFLSKSNFQFTSFYSREDLLQDFCMDLFYHLAEYELKKYRSFDSFCYFKAIDFLKHLQIKLCRAPSVDSLDAFYESSDDFDGSDGDSWVERKAICVSEYSYNLSYGGNVDL